MEGVRGCSIASGGGWGLEIFDIVVPASGKAQEEWTILSHIDHSAQHVQYRNVQDVQ